MERRPRQPEAEPQRAAGGAGFMQRHQHAIFVIHVCAMLIIIALLLRVYMRRTWHWLWRRGKREWQRRYQTFAPAKGI